MRILMMEDPKHAASCENEKESPAASQVDFAQRALAMKQDGASTTHPENSATPDEGLNPTPREDYPPSGAFDAEGFKPVLERSRKVR